MIHEFEALIMESDIDFMKLQRDMIISQNVEYFTESEDNAIVRFISNTIDRIKKIVEKIKNKIKNIFTSRAFNVRIDATQGAINTNGAIGNITGTMVDYKKLEKLHDDTIKEIHRDDTDVQETMKKYRSQRNKILAVSSAIVVTLSAALIFLNKNKNGKISELDQQKAEAEQRLKNVQEKASRSVKHYKTMASDLGKENDELKNQNELLRARTAKAKVKVTAKQTKRKINKKVDNVNSNFDRVKAQCVAEVECMADATKDIASQIKDTANIISSNDNIIKKSLSVGKTVASTTGTVKDVVTGDKYKKVINDKKSSIDAEINEIKEKRNRAHNILVSPNAPAERKEKARKYLDVSKKKIQELMRKKSHL